MCIVLNVITMSIEHHGMSTGLETGLKYANYVSTIFYETDYGYILSTKHPYKRSQYDLFAVSTTIIVYENIS